MSINKDFEQKIKEFNIEYLHDFFIFRNDGVPVYVKNENRKNAIGALVAGVFHASIELMNKNNMKTEEYNLNFSDTSSGVHIIKINVNDQEYFLGSVYQNEVNPGKLKVELRKISKNIIHILKNVKKEIKMRNEYLFKDISDNEIDAMFSTVGV